MHRHIQVKSQTDMIDKIFEFLHDITGTDPITVGTSPTYKITSKGNNRIIWFMRDDFISDFNVWITDVGETQKLPWLCPSTMALAARYKKDLSRLEPNTGKMSSDISKMLSELQQAYSYRMKYADNPLKKRLEYDLLRERQIPIRKNYIQFKDEPNWYRVDGVNMFHICATLKWNLAVPTTKSYKWLDCNYTDGNFMFSVYTDDIPNTTKNLVIGDFEMYDESHRQCFFFTNSYIAQSQTSYSDFHSGFFLEDEWGLGREPRSDKLYSEAYDTMKSQREAVNDIKAEVEGKRREVEAKQKEIDAKITQIEEKNKEILKLPETVANVEAERDAIQGKITETENAIGQINEQLDIITDPAELANLERLKYQYEQQLDQLKADLDAIQARLDSFADKLDKLRQELEDLEQELKDLRDELADLNNELEALEAQLKAAEEKWCRGDNSTYIKVLDTANDAAVRDSDYKHTKEAITPEKYQTDYESYMFAGLRFDADYDKDGDDEYCIKHEDDGEEEWYAFRWHINKQYLKIYNLYPPYSPSWPVIRSLRSQKQVAWEYQLGHLTYEEFAQTDTPNYYPQLDNEKETYEVSDILRDDFKKFEFFKRSGYGGDSVNHPNNVSQLMPLIWYVQRDDEQYNDWSAIGQSDVIKYVNMYNMGTGRLLQPQYPEPQNRYVNYYLWRRRPRWTDWIDEINDVQDSLKSVYGFGGYPGIGFMLKDSESLEELRRRVRQG